MNRLYCLTIQYLSHYSEFLLPELALSFVNISQGIIISFSISFLYSLRQNKTLVYDKLSVRHIYTLARIANIHGSFSGIYVYIK